jgi:plasmid stabilization system protein ParE
VKIRYTPKALAQLDAIYSYIEARDSRAAIAVKSRINRAIGRLARFPYSCRATERPGIRVLSIVRYPYLVFYTVDEAAQEVQILRVRHSAQDPTRHLD